MSADTSSTAATNDGRGEDSPRPVRARVNEGCLRQLEADAVMDEERRKKLRSLLQEERPPKAEEFVTLFQEQPEETVE